MVDMAAVYPRKKDIPRFSHQNGHRASMQFFVLQRYKRRHHTSLNQRLQSGKAAKIADGFRRVCCVCLSAPASVVFWIVSDVVG
jgi:hypothetical protein